MTPPYNVVRWKTLRVIFFDLSKLLKNDEKSWNPSPPDEIFWAAGQWPEGPTMCLDIFFYSMRTMSYDIMTWDGFEIIFLGCWTSWNSLKTPNPSPQNRTYRKILEMRRLILQFLNQSKFLQIIIILKSFIRSTYVFVLWKKTKKLGHTMK